MPYITLTLSCSGLILNFIDFFLVHNLPVTQISLKNSTITFTSYSDKRQTNRGQKSPPPSSGEGNYLFLEVFVIKQVISYHKVRIQNHNVLFCSEKRQSSQQVSYRCRAFLWWQCKENSTIDWLGVSSARKYTSCNLRQYVVNMLMKQGVALTGRNTTGPLCAIP